MTFLVHFATINAEPATTGLAWLAPCKILAFFLDQLSISCLYSAAFFIVLLHRLDTSLDGIGGMDA